MPSKTGVCKNVAGCSLAYRNQPVTIENSAAFCCPECGKPLQESGPRSSGSKAPIFIVGFIFLLVGLGLGGFLNLAKFMPKPATSAVTPPPGTPPASTPNPDASSPDASPVAASPPPATPPPATPPPATPLPGAPDSDTPPANTRAALVMPPPAPPVAREDNEEASDVKKQVLARIDALPKDVVSPADRDRLYAAVDHARDMSKIAVIHFDTGKAMASPRENAQVIESLQTPEVRHKLKDPTVVLFILGYADATGTDKRNLELSGERADHLVKHLGDEGGIRNVMRAIGMGNSSLFGRQQLAKNRIAEVWVVLP
jgi:outer membrane protein OmpA-like peptidoglycan-associated protein